MDRQNPFRILVLYLFPAIAVIRDMHDPSAFVIANIRDGELGNFSGSRSREQHD